MSSDPNVCGVLKTGLIVAAVIVVARVVSEQLALPNGVSAIFGVAWLYVLTPVFFGMRIAASGDPSPYKTLFKNSLLFAVGTRLMVLLTYISAYLFQWQAERFQLGRGGNVG